MSSITNNFKLEYEYDGEEYTEEASCTIDKTLIKPSVIVSKTQMNTGTSTGDTITYYVTIQVGAGDDDFSNISSKDVIQGDAEFIEGTLKVNGALADVQDLLNIQIDLQPNTIISVEYQCVII